MKIWIIQEGEPLPGIDIGVRDWRCGILARELADRGHEVLWWASTFDHFQKKHRCTESCTLEISSGIKLRLLHGPGYRSNKSLNRFLHQRTIARNFAKEARGFSIPDIIFCGMPLPELSEQALIYGQKYQVPVIIDVRDAWPDIYLTMIPYYLRGLARVVLAAEFRRIKWIFTSASAILAVSKTYLNWALKYANRSMCPTDRVFALGCQAFNKNIDEEEIAEFITQYSIQTQKVVITFAGIFGFSYDLKTVVQAAKILSSQNDNRIQIVLAGDGDAGPDICEMAKDLPNLVLTGWLDQKSIQVLLGLSSIGLVAYAEQATQTLPNKPFEYMAAGLTLLSSLRGEMEDLIRKEEIGLQYRAGDADSLVAGILWLVNNQQQRQAMGQRARSLFREQFDASVIYPKLAEYLEEVVHNERVKTDGQS
jgi:glycosyltransferase involved in cell wall biosynthesis